MTHADSAGALVALCSGLICVTCVACVKWLRARSVAAGGDRRLDSIGRREDARGGERSALVAAAEQAEELAREEALSPKQPPAPLLPPDGSAEAAEGAPSQRLPTLRVAGTEALYRAQSPPRGLHLSVGTVPPQRSVSPLRSSPRRGAAAQRRDARHTARCLFALQAGEGGVAAAAFRRWTVLWLSRRLRSRRPPARTPSPVPMLTRPAALRRGLLMPPPPPPVPSPLSPSPALRSPPAAGCSAPAAGGEAAQLEQRAREMRAEVVRLTAEVVDSVRERHHPQEQHSPPLVPLRRHQATPQLAPSPPAALGLLNGGPGARWAPAQQNGPARPAALSPAPAWVLGEVVYWSDPEGWGMVGPAQPGPDGRRPPPLRVSAHCLAPGTRLREGCMVECCVVRGAVSAVRGAGVVARRQAEL
eukprot:TRINITY_DN8694_c1_g1_i1.p1 TRINITY_DN8694_c1_g1~~TRINITY_DN8694_c1_g1_i1.p1  ORF type:complete len:417 (+),score=126.46 TRINITY_DN8694_c1_g1_i1:89-1339(+)